MIIKKILLLTVITLITTCIINYAQAPNANWIPVIELPNQSIFIDTSTVKSVENQISVLSLTIYKKPELIAAIGKEASNIKSQILFNVPLRKYTIIGTLYYDKNLKILGEISVPGFVTNSQVFSESVDSNVVMASIMDKTLSVLNKKETSSLIEKKSKPDLMINKSLILNDQKEPVKTNYNVIESKTPIIKTPVTNNQNDNTKKQLYQIPLRKDQIVKKDNSIKIISDSAAKKGVSKIPQTEKKILESKPVTIPNVKEPKIEKSYNDQNESNPKSTIFTDGTKYSFQVSSWKYKSKAETEVQKLKNQHHNAFISEGDVKGTTWYRVRIGFFNSLEETEAYMKKLK